MSVFGAAGKAGRKHRADKKPGGKTGREAPFYGLDNRCPPLNAGGEFGGGLRAPEFIPGGLSGTTSPDSAGASRWEEKVTHGVTPG